MRRLALISLIAYISIIFSPFVFAETPATPSTVDGMVVCDTTFDKTNTTDIEAAEKEIDGQHSMTCGESTSDGLLYKGDCTAENKVITEISEVFAGDVDTEGNEIKTVFKGTCCFVTEYDATNNNFKCAETREIYTLDYPTCTTKATDCQKRQWVIGTSGAGIIKVYVKQIYRWAAVTVGSVAVVTMIISGIQISVSGVSGDITAAKDKLLSALAGLVLLFLSGIILYTINPTFFS